MSGMEEEEGDRHGGRSYFLEEEVIVRMVAQASWRREHSQQWWTLMHERERERGRAREAFIHKAFTRHKIDHSIIRMVSI